LRTIYLGSSAFAVEVLETLAESKHRPTLVITPPDRPKGRGRRLASPPVATLAPELGIELLQTASVNEADALATIERHEPEAICVCEFGQLIKEPLLSRYLILNVHPSLLPRWRGAAPIERALMAGDSESGVTIFKITEGLDSGPIALMAREPIHLDDTAGTLASRLARLGGELLVEALALGDAGRLDLVEQTEEDATYASKIEPSERRLDPGWKALDLERMVRALAPHVGAYLVLEDGERLGVSAARSREGSLMPGEVQSANGLVLGCGEGVLELLEVQPPGKRAMPASEYLRGHRAARRALGPSDG
jgi:methionyl-tRNA formyltransferase